jgi:colanic acid biosynthesis glycosyl transferase WcaI
MNLLLLNQFYVPDVAPTGVHLHHLARALAARGHAVTVLCSSRSYNGGERFPEREEIEGVHVRRIRALGCGRRSAAGKLLDYGSFAALLTHRLLTVRPRPDVMVALTTPPYVGLLARWAAGLRGGRHAHWIMDLYPDVMLAHGMVKEGLAAAGALAWLTRRELRGSVLTWTLGADMAARVSRYAAPGGVAGGGAVEAIPLWADPALTPWPEGEPNPLRVARGWGPEDVVLLYSGNFGLGHRFGEYLAAAERRAGPPSVRWAFCGGGRRVPEVRERLAGCGGLRAEWLPYVPASELRAHLCAGDVHLVSFGSRWRGCMAPSKVQAAFAVGRPVVYVGPTEGEPATWIRESGGGWIVAEDDAAGLDAAIAEAADPVCRAVKARAAAAYSRSHFDAATLCGRIADLLERSVAG